MAYINILGLTLQCKQWIYCFSNILLNIIHLSYPHRNTISAHFKKSWGLCHEGTPEQLQENNQLKATSMRNWNRNQTQTIDPAQMGWGVIQNQPAPQKHFTNAGGMYPLGTLSPQATPDRWPPPATQGQLLALGVPAEITQAGACARRGFTTSRWMCLYIGVEE